MTRIITFLLLFVSSLTLNAQNAEVESTSTKELLLGKWILRKITFTDFKNKLTNNHEYPGLQNYNHEFKSDGSFIGNPTLLKKGTWALSGNSEILTLKGDNDKDIFELTIEVLNERELIWRSTSKEGVMEYTMFRFDPNHKLATVKLKFYKTYEDVAEDKFIASYDVNSGFNKNLTFIDDDGKQRKLKITDYPSDFYKFGDHQLYRRYKNEIYFIIIAGPFSYYSADVVSTNPERYSETINGPIKKFDNHLLHEKLKEYGLFEAYRKENPKREFRDSAQDYFDRQVARNIKYINLLNKILSKK